MINQTKHTHTPWKVFGNLILNSDADIVANSELPSHAAHIVKCVNMHDELVEALKLASNMLFATNNHQNEGYQFLQETLKKAGAL